LASVNNGAPPKDGNSVTQAQVTYSEPSISFWLEQAGTVACVMAVHCGYLG